MAVNVDVASEPLVRSSGGLKNLSCLVLDIGWTAVGMWLLSSYSMELKAAMYLSFPGEAHGKQKEVVAIHLVHAVLLTVLRIGVGGLLKIEEAFFDQDFNVAQHIVVTLPVGFSHFQVGGRGLAIFADNEVIRISGDNVFGFGSFSGSAAGW